MSASKMNSNTYNVLFQDKVEKIDQDHQDILNYIETRTMNHCDFVYLESAQLFMGDKPGKFVLKVQDMTLSYYRLSDFLLDSNLKKEALGKERYRKCHQKTIDFLEQNHYEAVTGYIYIQGKRQLHSVSRAYFYGEEVYIDFTGNLIMNQKDYEILFHFKPLETIDYQEWIEINQELVPYFETLSEKVLLTFGKEIEEDLKGRSLSRTIDTSN